MTSTVLTANRTDVLSGIETQLERTRGSMLGIGSALTQNLHKGYLKAYNERAKRWVSPEIVNTAWGEQCPAWRASTHGEIPDLFYGWRLACDQNHSETARELYQEMAKGHSCIDVSPFV